MCYSELCDTFSKKPVPHAYLPIFDQILSLQISLVFKPSDLCELDDTGGRKGNQQRTKVLMVMKIINNKNKRGCLLSVSLFSEVSLSALFTLGIKAGFGLLGFFRCGFNGADLSGFQLICPPRAKIKKAEPLLALPLSIRIRF